MSSYAPTEVGISRVINEDNVAFIFLEFFFFSFYGCSALVVLNGYRCLLFLLSLMKSGFLCTVNNFAKFFFYVCCSPFQCA